MKVLLLVAAGLALASGAYAETPLDDVPVADAPVLTEVTSYLRFDSTSYRQEPFPTTVENGFSSRADTFGVVARGEIAKITWRASIRAQVKQDSSKTSSDFRLNELNRVFTLGEYCSSSVGKRVLFWDVGYLRQPVGFFQTLPVLNDLNDIEGRVEGVPLLLLSCDAGQNWSVSAVVSGAQDSQRNSPQATRVPRQAALRISGQHDNLAFAAILRHADGQRSGLGATMTSTLGERVGWYASAYVQRGSARSVHAGLSEPYMFWRTDPYLRRNDNSIYPQWLLGATWNITDWLELRTEWAHDRNGLSDEEWRRWLALTRFHQRGAEFGVPAAAIAGNLLWDLQTLTSGARRNYALLSMSAKQGDWSGSVNAVINADDRSHLTLMNVDYRLSKTARLSIGASFFAGRQDSEYRLSPQRSAWSFIAYANF